GPIVATTPSSNNDGFFILTTKPSVWFYRVDTEALTEQSINFGQWPKASALASYGSSLYLLGDSTIYKHSKNSSGFSPKTDYLDISAHEETKGSSALAVDGSVYLLSPTGLHRYMSGSLKQSAPAPETLVGSKD